MKSKIITYIDSGAWSAYTQKQTIDIDAYIEYLQENAKYIDYYFNLDVIGDPVASLKNFLYMKRKGMDPIPVYHALEEKTSPLKFLYHYMDHTDYIAIGAIAKMNMSRRIQLLDITWADHLTYDDGMPKVKVHGLGMTSHLLMLRYPFYSVDSTSWVMYGRYGGILVPPYDSKQQIYRYDKNVQKVFISQRSPSKMMDMKHFDTYHDEEQLNILRYIEQKGYKIGSSVYSKKKKKEIVREEGLSNNHILRDSFNRMYYIEFAKTIPEWPWSFKSRPGTIFNGKDDFYEILFSR